MSDLGWLAVAFLAVWAGIGGYVFILGRRQSRLEQRLSELAGDDG
jgi:CcmD family protein